MPEGGPEPNAPGRRSRKYEVIAHMIAGPHPSLTNARRANFRAAVAATHRTGYPKPPTVHWSKPDEATITMEREAHEPSTVGETVRPIIRRNAEFVAQIGVRIIGVLEVSQPE